MNRRITLNGAARAQNKTLSEVRRMVILGRLKAFVYGETGIEPYEKRDGSRHALIFVYERSLKEIVNPLPPPLELSPPANEEFLLKRGAAKYLECSQHWLLHLAETKKIRAYVYADGVNLLPLDDQTSQRGRVLLFPKRDLENYKISIEEYKDDPLMPRLRQSFTDDEKRQIIAMANEQLKTKNYVSMRPIREALALPPTMYDDAIRRLREEQGWPMSHLQQQVSKARTKRNRTEKKTK